MQEVSIAVTEGRRRIETFTERYSRERDKNVNDIMTHHTMEVRRVENRAKWLARLLPPIFPLLLGGLVFGVRRSREREGVSQKRLR